MNLGVFADTVENICEVPPDRRDVARARAFAERLMAQCSPACREAVTMAVQEFAENLAKYGAWDTPAGTIALRLTGDAVRIRVRNFVRTAEDGEQARQMIEEINAAADVRVLYSLRQSELRDDPTLPRGRLGLLRIALEGGFRLSCCYEHPILEIVAVRP